MRNLVILIFIPVIITACRPSTTNQFPETVSVEVINPLSESRKDVEVFIPFPDASTIGAFTVRSNEVLLPAQKDSISLLVVLDSLKANEKRIITVYYNTSGVNENYNRKRTQAELSHRFGGEWKDREYIGGKFRNVDHLRVPPEHKDHSWFLRYEGPGWESEKVGYRFYLDQRNAIDVFGKKTPDMVLMGVGQDGFDSYHNMQSWGMDIMKVGKSLGLGSIGVWSDTTAIRIEKTDSVECDVHDGDLSSWIRTCYYGWKTPHDTVDVTSSLAIYAGTRLTYHAIEASKNLASLCTGIVKDKEGKVFKSMGGNSSWGYMATFGKQSLNNDNLGLVVLFPPESFVAFHEDAFSNVVEFKMIEDGEGFFSTAEYFFGAAWELEPHGITNETDFIKWVEKSARELANPVIVNVNVK